MTIDTAEKAKAEIQRIARIINTASAEDKLLAFVLLTSAVEFLESGDSETGCKYLDTLSLLASSIEAERAHLN